VLWSVRHGSQSLLFTPPYLLLTPTPWDDQSFAILGEVVQGLVSIVSFPEDTFDTVTEQVKTLNYMAQNQAELVDLPVVLPVVDDDEDAKEVTSCNLIFLLTADVPLLEFSWLLIETSLGNFVSSNSSSEWISSKCTTIELVEGSNIGTPFPNHLEMGNPLVDKRITAPPADEVLLAHCHAILHQAPPGLAAPPQTLEIVLTQMVTVLIAQMNDTRQAREQKLADDQEPKLPSTCFTVTLPVFNGVLTNQRQTGTTWSV